LWGKIKIKIISHSKNFQARQEGGDQFGQANVTLGHGLLGGLSSCGLCGDALWDSLLMANSCWDDKQRETSQTHKITPPHHQIVWQTAACWVWRGEATVSCWQTKLKMRRKARQILDFWDKI